jgi:single-stranded DNA-binding protein
VYVEGRLHSHSWKDPEGVQKAVTEIIIDDMVMLDSKPQEDRKEAVDEPNGQATATGQN